MQVRDMRMVAPGTTLEADLAIIGTGPAGLSIAREFFGSRVRVILLECGGLAESREVAASEGFESVGAPRVREPRLVRNRVFGGSSHSWSGKCRTFDDIDFERRPWVRFSGWPIGREDVSPYSDRAAELMQLGPNVYDHEMWNILGKARPKRDVSPDLLMPCFWQFARDPKQPMEFLRFGPHFLSQTAENIQAYVHAPVTQLCTDESGRRLTSLEVTPAPGRTVRIVPKIAVLAGGGLENARLLLASRRTRASGVGNQNDLVGRFLMDHPRISLGHYGAKSARAVQARLGLFQLRQRNRTHVYSHGLALSPALQRQKQLLNCAAYLSEHRSEDDPWDALKRLYTRSSPRYLTDMRRAVADPMNLVEGLYQRFAKGRNVRHKVDRLVFDCLVEQQPDPESRVTLSERRDEQGQPIARVNWKISELEKRSVAELASILAQELARIGLGAPIPPAWLAEGGLPESFTDVAHPTGTTRMSDDPAHGVVDRNCRLHEVGNVYVAGSSVFPTASHANPTLMIVSMALRLADWLKHTHFGPTAAEAWKPGAVPA
ncbi:choline dehydrogenase-like flavoprotein [Mesorhizobium soli]|nr:choline dehydrogenase-like flavoprotein [Mesorhizobium soli]